MDVVFRILTVDQGFWSFRVDVEQKLPVYRGHLEGIPLSDFEQVNQRGCSTPPSPGENPDPYILPRTIVWSVPYLKEGVQLPSAATSRYVAYQTLYSTLFGGRSSSMLVPPEILYDYHSHNGGEYQEDHEIWLEIALEAKKMIHFFCTNRCIFVTQRGYIGLGSDLVKKGDLVCVLFGSTMPFVLRSIGSAEAERFRLLGVSYVHGIMDGELWRKGDDGQVEPTEGVELRSFTLV